MNTDGEQLKGKDKSFTTKTQRTQSYTKKTRC